LAEPKVTLKNQKRRQLLKGGLAAALAGSYQWSWAAPTVKTHGAGELLIFSDGHLVLPTNFLYDSQEQLSEIQSLYADAGIPFGANEPSINVTLWRHEDRLVLFDIGSGAQWMETAGKLPAQLELAGIDPADITDVVFTHAHPDHLWGVLDDFDDLFCPNATYHMHGQEYDYWMSEDTLNNTPEARLNMVAGARNRLPLIEPRLNRFNWGDEILPGVEAVDTHGHTPGHSSFALHQGGETLMILGDALTHSIISFARPEWIRNNDVMAQAAVNTRLSLLDRLATDKTQLIGYHLPGAGLGAVVRRNKQYHYEAYSG